MGTRRQEISDHPACGLPTENPTIQSYLRMCDATATGHHDVSYLSGIDNRGREMIYSWFTHNRMNPESVLRLPEPLDSVLTLPTRRRKGDNRLQTKEPTSEMIPFLQCKYSYPIGTSLDAEVLEIDKKENIVKLKLNGIPYIGVLKLGKDDNHYEKGNKITAKVSIYDNTNERIIVKI